MEPAEEEVANDGVDRDINTPIDLSDDIELNTPIIPVEDVSDDDDLQVVSEHLVPPEENQGVQLNLPVSLQAKLLAAVRASNVNIPDLASARIKIFSKYVSEGTGNCRIIMSQPGGNRESQSTSTFSIPYSELTQPSTSKGSRLAGACPSPSPELVDLVNQLDESQTSKKLSSADRSNENDRPVPCDANSFLVPEIPVDETAEEEEVYVNEEPTEAAEASIVIEEETDSQDVDNSDFFSELVKVQETIANFDEGSEAEDSFGNDIQNDFEDEFRSASPCSKDDDSDCELKNLVSEDDSAKSPVHTSDLLQLQEDSENCMSSSIKSPQPRPAPLFLVPTAPPWCDETSCDIEEGQVVSLLDTSSSDDDDIMEIPQDQTPEEVVEEDQFVSQVTPLPWSILRNLDIQVHGVVPFLAVTTFDQLYDNFHLDTQRLVRLLESEGDLVQDHLIFQGWSVTHVSFKVAHKIVGLAGGEPPFLHSFLKRSCNAASFVDVKEFKCESLIPDTPPEKYFNKTNLSECSNEEFKSLFGLVSHSEASDIREKAKIVKRRLLRPDRKLDDFLNKKKKQDQPKASDKKWLLPKSHNKENKETGNDPVSKADDSALVSGSLSQKLKDISIKNTAEPVKKQINKTQEKEKSPKESAITEETSENKVETFEVKQTREMKRKGIKLPRGWHIYGKRKVSETKSDGHVYQYFRIDWQFRAPDGRNFRSLKRALEEVKKHPARREKWEVKQKHGKQQESSKHVPENPPKNNVEEPEYLTLKAQVEKELDLQLEKDVYSLSGIRPVRKFATEDGLQPGPKNSSEGSNLFSPSCPQRMSALKQNPITPAQYKLMMGRVPPHAASGTFSKFSLANVGEVIGPLNDGWLSSKLENLRKISPEDVPEDQQEVVYSCPGPLTSNPLTAEGRVVVEIFSETERRTLMDLDVYRSKLSSGELEDDCLSTSLPRKVVRTNFALPEGWVRKLNTPKKVRGKPEDNNSFQFVSPDGQVFNDLDSVLSFIQFQCSTFPRDSKKSLPTTPRKSLKDLNVVPVASKQGTTELKRKISPSKRSGEILQNTMKLKVPEINLKPLSIPKWRVTNQATNIKTKQPAGPSVSKSKSIIKGNSPKSSKQISTDRKRTTVRGKVNKIVRSLSHSSRNMKKGKDFPGKYLSPGKSPPRKRVSENSSKNRSPPKKRKFLEIPSVPRKSIQSSVSGKPKKIKMEAVRQVAQVSEVASPKRERIQENVVNCPSSPDSLNDLLMDSDDDSKNSKGQEEKDNNMDLTSAIEEVSSPLKKSMRKHL